MSFLRALFGPSKEEIWSQIAREFGGRYEDGGFFGKDCVRVRCSDWEILLDTYTERHNKHSHTYTRIRAPFINKDGLYFRIYRSGLFTPLGKMIGLQDIEIGQPAFDEAYVIKGNNEAKLRQFFAHRPLQICLGSLAEVDLEIRDDEGWLGASFPDGVDMLYCSRRGLVTDAQELRDLFDLFSASLERLVAMDSAYEDDPGIRL
ncbi:MAG: hypothetical protein RL095_1602 [Verrucomicrobiota bacterium]|jgi:hypothetical protein